MADSTYSTKNYRDQSGDKWVIGGELEILPEGKVTGLPALPVAENQAASAATTIAGLKEDFNALLTKLKAAGLMAADEVTDA